MSRFIGGIGKLCMNVIDLPKDAVCMLKNDLTAAIERDVSTDSVEKAHAELFLKGGDRAA